MGFPFGFPFGGVEQDYSDEESDDHAECKESGECKHYQHQPGPQDFFNNTSYFFSNPGPNFGNGFGPNFASNSDAFPAGNSSVMQGRKRYIDPKTNRYCEVSVKFNKDGEKVKTKRIFNPETQEWNNA